MMEFLKRNATSYPDALLREAEGLRSLAATLKQAGVSGTGALKVPDVLRVSETELVIPRVGSGGGSESHMAALGEGLARMHRQPMADYGWDKDNLIGLSRQYNARRPEWGRFYLDYRIQPQLEMIGDESVRREFQSQVAAHAHRLEAFLNEHCDHPSLLHGDLWSGNVLFDEQGPWLIDPAVYCGDREADVAMTELFGGFTPTFYRTYDEVYPRTSVYDLKRPIYNLYHTLNHYNLFGASYLGACSRNLQALEML